jgi:hypothetical protein
MRSRFRRAIKDFSHALTQIASVEDRFGPLFVERTQGPAADRLATFSVHAFAMPSFLT